MKIFIENPCDTTLKKEFNEETKEWEEIGHLAVPYPFPYGFIPSTNQEDGDPLDAFLVTSKPSSIKRGDVFTVSILGLIEYFEDGERDYKILARRINEKIELNSRVKKKLKDFLLHAFDNRPGKKVKFNGFYDKTKALEEIEKCLVK